ncbi:cisplatin damage response ATP-dependent DNA ligase [Algimonas porphyrae]|uniref:DNA ligase (ATP) n=1 Tax=Algimonas porphyrae TaxID=1128113 RepID=A0ABQ5V234_9PROT|nr:cisplatin damage response ATP-dependent DNA ligase [Algimonas porphyrae]GLQ20759.1 ATP-dependent DNA ligase [Algimonas porphyrae]
MSFPAFADLLDDLYFTNSNLAKEAILAEFLRTTPDPDRGWALAAIGGTLSFDLFKRNLVKTLMEERMDPYLFQLSRHYVGEMSETVALAWPQSPDPVRLNRLPDLHEVIEEFKVRNKAGIRDYLITLLDNMAPHQRWALLKLGTRGLRIGMSARTVKKALANMKGVDVGVIEELWHGISPPYADLFAWIDGTAAMPDISQVLTYSPVMLSHPIDEEADLDRLSPDTHTAEWKWDGIRVQVAGMNGAARIYSRTGDDISHSFPDLAATVNWDAVIDGELLVRPNSAIGSFNDLQQRLGKKKPSAALMKRLPAHLIAYDIISQDGVSFREQTLDERRDTLSAFIAERNPDRYSLSELLDWKSVADLKALREDAAASEGLKEGLMIKRRDSSYVAGRPKHAWYKWKRDPFLLDAVLMYAQRGTGKRSSFYSDYTFGLWKTVDGEETLLPIGKAYFGFTDEELKQLDSWIRRHKVARFGPVQEVEKELVFEVAFDSAHRSARHKSGYALRFPRISRIRWDKPAHEADRLEIMETIIGK